MDGSRFDRITRELASARSRRSVLKTLLGSAAGVVAAAPHLDAAVASGRLAGQLCRKHGDCQSGFCGRADRTGRRRCECPAGTVGCNGACLDPATAFARDDRNCGACGFTCPTLQACCDGACVPAWSVCNGACCASTQLCYDGACCDPRAPEDVCAEACGQQSIGCGHTTDCGPCCGAAGDGCEGDSDCCDGACVDGQCAAAPGEIGAACDGDDRCRSGVCCGGQCVAVDAFDADPDNCGSCGYSCPGTDSECATRTCAAGACGTSYAPPGTVVTNQTAGDCKRDVCDGAGGVIAVDDDADVPADDGNQCTTAVCRQGTPAHEPLAAGAACNQHGGSVCDGQGGCVQCVTASDCPGNDTECQTRTCTNGACGLAFIPSGTPAAEQTAGDCQKNICDGAGNVTTIADDADLPEASSQCMRAVCSGGTPGESPLDAGTSCGENGGAVCDGAGHCVECLDGTACASGVCLNGGACCVEDDPATTCAGECGSVANNCGKPVDCGVCCPAGQRPSSTGSGCVPDQSTCSAAMETGAFLTGADLRECDFSGVDVASVNLSNANLTGASFVNATLTGVDFQYALLNGVNFSGATLVSTAWAFASCPDGVEAGMSSATPFSCCGNMNGNTPASCS